MLGAHNTSFTLVNFPNVQSRQADKVSYLEYSLQNIDKILGKDEWLQLENFYRYSYKKKYCPIYKKKAICNIQWVNTKVIVNQSLKPDIFIKLRYSASNKRLIYAFDDIVGTSYFCRCALNSQKVLV